MCETPNSIKVSPATTPDDSPELQTVSSLFDRIKQLQADLRSSQSENSRLRVMLETRFDTCGVNVSRQRRNYEFVNRALVALTGEPPQVATPLVAVTPRRGSGKRDSSNDLLQANTSTWNCACFPLTCRETDDDEDEWEDTSSCYN